MIRARIADDYLAGGIAVLIEQRGDGARLIYHAGERGHVRPDIQLTGTALPDGGELAPTLRMDEDVARALLQALANWYGGTSEAATARADLLHERGRVDQLISTVSVIASAQHLNLDTR